MKKAAKQKKPKAQKKRNKKYQGIIPKRHQFIGFTIEHWKGWGKDQDHDGMAELRNQRGLLKGPDYWDAMCKFEYRWRVLARVKMQTSPDADIMFKDYEITTKEVCKLNDLEEIYKELEAELISKTQERHILDTGWWACAIE